MGILDVGFDRQLEREERERRRAEEEERARQARAEEQRRAAIRESNLRIEQNLRAAVNRITDANAREEDIRYILSEFNAWQALILSKIDTRQARYFIDNISSFPEPIVIFLQSILPMLQIKSFEFTNGLVQGSELRDLLRLTQNPANHDLLFISKLNVFADKIGEQLLDDKQTLCLKRIVDDYKVGLLGISNSIENLVADKLLASITLSQLHSKHQTTQGLNISVSDFPDYLNVFRQRIAALPTTLKQSKLLALTELETRIQSGDELPELVARDIETKHPIALSGFYSRTRKLVNDIATVSERQLIQG